MHPHIYTNTVNKEINKNIKKIERQTREREKANKNKKKILLRFALYFYFFLKFNNNPQLYAIHSTVYSAHLPIVPHTYNFACSSFSLSHFTLIIPFFLFLLLSHHHPKNNIKEHF